jgi:hypothetical protein
MDGIKVRGSYRLKVLEGDKVVGDSGRHENQVVNTGFNDFLCKTLGKMAGSQQIAHVALGTGSEPGATDTSLQGEVTSRAAVTAATSSGSKTVRFTATFASSDSFVSASRNISNIGLFSTNSGGSIFAGNTYASSSVATNQAVNVTYDIIFA